ncbi:MAG TPA: SbcC/MukB-like Walker B domain-containing protein, partial [Dermatophilaceae bacterium]
EPVFESARKALAALAEVPGLVVAGLGSDRPGVQAGDIAQADTRTATAILGVEAPPRAVDANAVLAASRDLQSGPAATLEPRVAEIHGVLTAVGQDDSAEIPLVDLAERLRVSVAADRELLTERERRLFEDHILGSLGDALRRVRLKAEELVTAMNQLLHGVTTSQGIRVRLRWKLRDDIPPQARRAVQLLGEPLGALLADERRDLRESLHQLIEVSRADAPDESYAEHLARALDYRRWFTFRIQYHRPEAPDWTALHRKSPLSQGEQKVLCYLPLFAAAAAHFTSIAGAAPYAPRFVLLDDAFPKIDVRTHPLLFGLLVDLDLDFVITSERLWGDHATVPELAIYEALRSPTERGIAQYEHRWDGYQLIAVGA